MNKHVNYSDDLLGEIERCHEEGLRAQVGWLWPGWLGDLEAEEPACGGGRGPPGERNSKCKVPEKYQGHKWRPVLLEPRGQRLEELMTRLRDLHP